MSSKSKHNSEVSKTKPNVRPKIRLAKSSQNQVPQPQEQHSRSRLPSQEESDRIWDQYAAGEIDLLTFLKLSDPYSDED